MNQSIPIVKHKISKTKPFDISFLHNIENSKLKIVLNWPPVLKSDKMLQLIKTLNNRSVLSDMCSRQPATHISSFDNSQWLSSISTFLNSWLPINALTTDEANSKHRVLRESNARWMSRTNVTRFLLACFTLDLTSAYEVPADDMSSTRLCQNCGWYRAVLQCLHVDEAATLDSGERWVNTWWRARLGREFQLTVSISTRNNRDVGVVDSTR